MVLNGQFSSWADVAADFSQGSILGAWLFLIYINDLSSDLSQTSIFKADKDTNVTKNKMNEDLKRMKDWLFH